MCVFRARLSSAARSRRASLNECTPPHTDRCSTGREEYTRCCQYCLVRDASTTAHILPAAAAGSHASKNKIKRAELLWRLWLSGSPETSLASCRRPLSLKYFFEIRLFGHVFRISLFSLILFPQCTPLACAAVVVDATATTNFDTLPSHRLTPETPVHAYVPRGM